MQVYVLNATSTSQGNGPGYADLPDDEALWLLNDGLAIRGNLPPPNHEGSHGPVGQPNPVTPQ
jgi:hypothetical protein